jgi:hypothetical protein
MKAYPVALAVAAVSMSALGCFSADVEAQSVCTEGSLQFGTVENVPTWNGDGTVTMTSTITFDLDILRDLQERGSLALVFETGVLRFAPGQLANLQSLEATVESEGATGDPALIMSYVLPAPVRQGREIDLGSTMDTATLLAFLQSGATVVTYVATLQGEPWDTSLLVKNRICVNANMRMTESL